MNLLSGMSKQAMTLYRERWDGSDRRPPRSDTAFDNHNTKHQSFKTPKIGWYNTLDYIEMISKIFTKCQRLKKNTFFAHKEFLLILYHITYSSDLMNHLLLSLFTSLQPIHLST